MPEYYHYGQSLERERPTVRLTYGVIRQQIQSFSKLQPDPQDSFDYHDAYKEYGIYDRHQSVTLVENPMMNDPRSMIDPRYYKVDSHHPTVQPQQISEAAKRRIQFQQRW